MRIACIQTPAFALTEARAAANYLLSAIDQAARAKPAPDLILLPEMCYPAYYLKGAANAAALDQQLAALGAPTLGMFAVMLSGKARAFGVHIAAGLAVAGAGGSLLNAMVLYDRQGNETLRVGKQFLWHFDACWFAPGAPPPVVNIDGIPTGLFICCDGRAPEIPRRLALAGAKLLLDATNWVATGRDPKAMLNAQPDYMMRVRAMENGCWFAAANKVGREADSIAYCGKSCIIGPDGAVVAMATGDSPEMLVADVPVLPGGGWGGMVPRRAGEYRRMAPTCVHQPAPAGSLPPPAPFVATLQVGDDDPDVGVLLADMAIQGSHIAVLPEGTRPLSYWLSLSEANDLLLVATGIEGNHRVTWLLDHGQVLGSYAKGHPGGEDRSLGLRPGPAEPPVFDTRFGRIGLMTGEDGLVPEVARGLALAGADLIAWPHRFGRPLIEAFARTRAAENRVFVATAGCAVPGGESLVIDPGGVPMSRTFPGARQAVAAYCILCLARHKEIVPGTSALNVPRFAELV